MLDKTKIVLADLWALTKPFWWSEERWAARELLAASIRLLLMPMAGLAIGLVQTSERLFPVAAAPVTALVLAAVAVFDFLGPPVVGWAFRVAGETWDAAEPGVAPKREAAKRD